MRAGWRRRALAKARSSSSPLALGASNNTSKATARAPARYIRSSRAAWTALGQGQARSWLSSGSALRSALAACCRLRSSMATTVTGARSRRLPRHSWARPVSASSHDCSGAAATQQPRLTAAAGARGTGCRRSRPGHLGAARRRLIGRGLRASASTQGCDSTTGQRPPPSSNLGLALRAVRECRTVAASDRDDPAAHIRMKACPGGRSRRCVPRHARARQRPLPTGEIPAAPCQASQKARERGGLTKMKD